MFRILMFVVSVPEPATLHSFIVAKSNMAASPPPEKGFYLQRLNQMSYEYKSCV